MEEDYAKAVENDLITIDDLEDEEPEPEGEPEPKGGEEGQDPEDGDEPKKADDEEMRERAKQAEMRRERDRKRKEREERIRREAYEEGKRAGALESAKSNPFTGKPIKDEHDLSVYRMQQELEEEGKDPMSDLPEKLAEAERMREAQSRKEADDRKKVDDDIREAMAAHPEYGNSAKMRELINDPTFSEFADGKLGNRPLKDIISSYKRLIGDGRGKKEEGSDGGKRGSVPPKSSGEPAPKPKSYSEMTREERIAYLRKNHRI